MIITPHFDFAVILFRDVCIETLMLDLECSLVHSHSLNFKLSTFIFTGKIEM